MRTKQNVMRRADAMATLSPKDTAKELKELGSSSVVLLMVAKVAKVANSSILAHVDPI